MRDLNDAVASFRQTTVPHGVFQARLGDWMIVAIFTRVNLKGHQHFLANNHRSCGRTATPAFLDIAYPIT
jgi:hypothetical protein